MPPSHPQAAALLRDASAALQRGKPAVAVQLLRQASAIDPEALEIQLHIALACRAAGDVAGGLAALDAVLAQDPKHFVALLSKGTMIEAAAGARQAVAIYRNALRLAPPAERLPPGLAEALRHATDVVAADQRTLHAHMLQATADLRASFAGQALDRFDESLEVFAGVAEAPVQRPMLLRYSRMPAIPFYDRALFPFLAELEAATDVMAAELRGVLRTAPETFAPYVQYPPGVPVNQWGELNHSPRWSSYFLWQDGTRHDAACARCPYTAALMDRLPLMHQPGFAPTVVFSALEPHTHIPPHTGSANTRLLCHLPLILPGPARFRVGPQTRDWRMGEAWVFDDTIEHEAWNDAGEMRVILIIDLWNPLLSPAERDLVTAMMSARNGYYAAGAVR